MKVLLCLLQSSSVFSLLFFPPLLFIKYILCHSLSPSFSGLPLLVFFHLIASFMKSSWVSLFLMSLAYNKSSLFFNLQLGRFWTLFIYQQEAFPWSFQRQPTVFSDPSLGTKAAVLRHTSFGELNDGGRTEQKQQTDTADTPLFSTPISSSFLLLSSGDSQPNNVIHCNETPKT